MNLSHTLTQILTTHKSTYDAAQEIALTTNNSTGTVHKRLSQWLKKDPETWVKINQYLNALGYKLEIVKMNNSTYPQDGKGKYIEVWGEKVEVLEIVQVDAENSASLVTTEDETRWVGNDAIKDKK